MGLFQNIKLAMAIQSAMLARGVAACLSAEANAELLKDCGAPAKDVAKMKLDAMRQKTAMHRQGMHR
jgi:hypothetical protein